jgi:trehalose 6-phosphate phosphatase
MTDDLNAPPRPPLSDIALFFDVDGTLVAIEQQPEAVRVSAELRVLLERLIAATDGALALVSGRSIEQLDRLFKPLLFSASGLHGLERRLLPGEVERAVPAKTGMEAAKRELERFARNHPGTFVEDKGLTLALHYRMAAQHRETAAALVRKLVEADPEGLVLLEGKMVFELKPPGFDKGRAIVDFMQEPPFQGRRPIFAGDDVTDEAGFAKINELGGIAVKVGIDERSTEAEHGLADVEAMIEWLDDLVGDESRDPGEGA